MASYQTTRYGGDTAIRLSNLVTNKVTIASGQNLVAGNVIGIVTATGKAINCLDTATDGSKVPYGVVLNQINTGATGYNADTDCEVMVSGSVDFHSLVLDAGWTQDELRLAFKPQGIHLINSMLATKEGAI